MKYDFGGWATRNDLRCADGRIIRKDAFIEDDGETRPLVWNHQHNSVDNILGHALLENREDGVYAYCTFNDTESGKNAKELVQHGDIVSLSIFANQLKQNGSNVLHGEIKEVSLVLAGANPGAYIDFVISHGEESEEAAVIYTGFPIESSKNLSHADGEAGTEDERTVQDVIDTMTDEQKTVMYILIDSAKNGVSTVSPSDEKGTGKTAQDVIDTMSEDQKTVMYALIGLAMDERKENGNKNDENEEDEEDEGGETVKHNLFEYMGNDSSEKEDHLSHAEREAIIKDAKKYGSLKESVLAHGIENVDYLFPDAQVIENTPMFLQRGMAWVSKFMDGVHHTPFGRVKSIFADITEDEARAKGYIKGKMKKEEFFSLIKRSVGPQTVYKKQKLDRDDVIDITDFNVIFWLKTEMRMMLNEEIARAGLVGDGRPSSSDDKINETNIIPIWKDNELYAIHSRVDVSTSASMSEIAAEFIDQTVRAMEDYDGSGNVTMFVPKNILTAAILLKDENGRRIYKDSKELATAMLVDEIVPVPVMKGLTRTVDADILELLGIGVDLNDYNIGADNGGSVNMFDDFDIDYNAMKYLIETRISGALVRPKSAIVLERKTNA